MNDLRRVGYINFLKPRSNLLRVSNYYYPLNKAVRCLPWITGDSLLGESTGAGKEVMKFKLFKPY